MIKKIYKAFPLIILFSLSFVLFQCSTDKDDQTENINTDNIKVTVDIKRFEQDLFSANNVEEVLALEKKYPDFYPVYVYQLMGDITGGEGVSPQEAAANLMRNFTTVPEFGLMLKQRADSIFSSFEPFKVQLVNALKRYKYFFPTDTIPQFITFLSPLRINFPNIEGSHQMGIGLDMYLGSDFGPYHAANLADQFPNYRIRKMRKEYLLRDLLTAMSENKLAPLGNNSRLIDEMIHEGKILYMVNALIPDEEDSIKLGYTPDQLKWAQQSESEIWAILVDSKALYTTDPAKVRDYISDGPFTTATGFGMGTAPRVGSFIGWQIVKKYMQKYSNLSLPGLLLEADTDEILTKSKYKP